MIEVKDKIKIQIEITNACIFSCTNCYKLVGHYVKPHYMDLETVKKAIDSLEGYNGKIGITGGEPTLHPHFAEICGYIRKKVAPDQRYLQTTGYRWNDFKSIIKKTFFSSHVHINDHKDLTEKHHPMLVAIKDVVEDASLRNDLIDNCWVQEKWSALITSKGCFSCEVASALDVLHNGPGGLPIEKAWWTKDHKHFKKQMKSYCNLCGGALPQPPLTSKNKKDHVTISNYRRLKELNASKFQHNRVMLLDFKYSPKDIRRISESWEPWLSEGEESLKKSNLKRFKVIFKDFFRYRISVMYVYKKFRILERRLWSYYWSNTRKAD